MPAETVKEIVSDLLFHDGKAVLEIRIEYPRAEGYITGGFESAFNSFYERRARLFNISARNEAFAEAKRNYTVCKRQGLPFTMHSATYTYENVYISDSYLSLCLRRFTYTGGAHGYTEMQGDVWSLSACRRVTVSELCPQPDIRSRIRNAVITAIKEDRSGKFFPDAVKTAERTLDLRRYWLTEGGICVFYPLYALAPYYAGIQSFQTGIQPS